MCFATLFPEGALQLYHSIAFSYYDARSLNYLQSGMLPTLEWLRLPGDMLFIVGGTLPLVVLSWRGGTCTASRKADRASRTTVYRSAVRRRGSDAILTGALLSADDVSILATSPALYEEILGRDFKMTLNFDPEPILAETRPRGSRCDNLR